MQKAHFRVCLFHTDNIMKIYHFTEASAQELLISNYRSSTLIPFLGAGFTKDMRCKRGKTPDGNELKKILKDILARHNPEEASEIEEIDDLRSIFSLFENSESISSDIRKNTLLNLFSQVKLDDIRKKILSLGWRNIITLNIDDAIEKHSHTDYNKISPSDKISMERVKSKKNIIKLHGCITEYDKNEDSQLIFTWRSYVHNIRTQNSILEYLENLAREQAFIFIGCSLDGEIDLIPIGLKGHLEKSIYITKNKPSLSIKLKLKEYGIGHVVYFDSYDQIYSEIFNTIGEVEVEDTVTEYHIDYLPTIKDAINTIEHIANGGPHHKTTTESNISYEILLRPGYVIERDAEREILNNIYSSKIIAITGRRFSGKTTTLIHLYEKIKQYQTYIFSSHHPFNPNLTRLIRTVSNSLFMFDTNYIPRSMMRDVVREISRSKNKAIFVFNNHDKDSLLEVMSDDEINCVQFDMKSRLSAEEMDKLNVNMNTVGIQRIEEGMTILTFAYNTHEVYKSSSKSSSLFDFKTPDSSTYKALILTELESKLDLDITNKCLGKYFNTDQFIKSNPLLFDLEWHSGIRHIVCNSTQIALRILSKFSKENITSSAKIISELAVSLKEGGYIDTADKLISFDFLNSTFSWESSGNARLIKLIYEQLSSAFGQKNHYWLQRAKCELRSSNKLADIDNGIIWAKKVRSENALMKNKTYYSATLTMAQLYGKKVVLLSKLSQDINRDILNGVIDYYSESISNYMNNKGHIDDISKKFREGRSEISKSFEILRKNPISLERVADINAVTTFLSNKR